MSSPSRPARKRHQDDDIRWIHKVKRGLLGNEPGTGKSRSAIEAFDGGNNLVIAPALVIEGGTWADEINKWSDHPEKWTVVPYSRLNVRDGNRLLNVGTDSQPKYVVRPEYDQAYDAVIIDEAHYTKGRHTSWALAANEIAAKSGSLLEMTGTPMPNWAHELFMVLQAIFPEKAKRGRELGSYWRWAKEWFDVTPSQHNPHAREVGDLAACRPKCLLRPPTDPCVHYQEFVEENLGDHFRRVLRADCLDLPPLTEQTVHTPMDAAQKRMYREMKKDFVTTVNDSEVVAWNQGAKNVALDRITTSPWCLDPSGPAKGGKFERLRFDLSSRSQPTLVLAHYRTSVEGCADIARQVGASTAMVHGGVSSRDRERAVRRFQSGDLDVLVGSLETLAEGLTLTAADMAIFVEKSFKPSRNVQATYRIHRMGQTKPCSVLDYVTPSSVDSKKRDLIATKTDRQVRVLSAAQFKALL